MLIVECSVLNVEWPVAPTAFNTQHSTLNILPILVENRVPEVAEPQVTPKLPADGELNFEFQISNEELRKAALHSSFFMLHSKFEIQALGPGGLRA
jgi:membrane-anchored protein YejM (alkaline phosphatase superfamily)